MIDASKVTGALEALFGADLPLRQAVPNLTISRAAPLNADPGLAPWLGIYRRGVVYEPRQLGNGLTARNWRAVITADVALQVVGKDGPSAEASLEVFVQAALAAVERDRTLGGMVLTIDSYEVGYAYQEDQTSTLAFQMATITLKAEIRA